jgi:hypothetical protein
MRLPFCFARPKGCRDTLAISLARLYEMHDYSGSLFKTYGGMT